MSKAITFKYSLPFLIVSAALITSYALIARAQTNSSPNEPSDAEIAAKGITFPIPELGNCSSKDSCRDYCNKAGNMDTCIKFAQDHGLMNKIEASQATKFKEKLAAGVGPGGCNSPESCKSFCGNTANLDICIQFAEKSGFKEKKIEEAKKVQSFLKSGGQMPGGCNSEESCRAYCGDFSHAKECFEFAQRAGITQVEGEAGGHTLEPEQFKKFIELAEKGETPGGCKSKEQCERYCQSESNKEECIVFGQKMGFIDEKEAELFRKTGGKGPGGCNSEESCRAYCNDPGNQEACFKFAEEHGLIDQEEIKHAKEGFVRLRQGLEQAPPEVAECLKSTLGPNIIQDIQSGNLTPGPQIGDRVKGCFEKFGHRGDPKEAFSQAPPEITSCVKEKLGDVFEKIKSGEAMPTPEMGDAFRVCNEQLRLLQQPIPGGERQHEGPEGRGSDISAFLRSAPPGVANCLQEKLGGDFERIKSGGKLGAEIGDKLRDCFHEFRPETPPPQEFKEGEQGGIRPAGLKEFKEGLFPPGGLIHPQGSSTGGFGGPGGCKSPEECRAYCEKNPQECGGHGQSLPPGGDQGQTGGKYGCPQPAPAAPNYQCADGSTAGPVCEGDASGQYHWVMRQCSSGKLYPGATSTSPSGYPYEQHQPGTYPSAYSTSTQYQQYQKPPEGTTYPTASGTYPYPSPSGSTYTPPPTGTIQPPPPPPSGTYTPPSSGTYTSPPAGITPPTYTQPPPPAPAPAPAPTTQTERPSFLSNILQGLRYSFGL